MGTNFYLEVTCPNACEHCSVEPLHIGKRSMGWQFIFQAYFGLRSRKDWEILLQTNSAPISDENGVQYTPDELWEEVDSTRRPGALTHCGMRGQQGIPLNDPRDFVDADGWDFTECDFS